MEEAKNLQAHRNEQVYIPTVFENYALDISVDGMEVEVALWDTAGQEGYQTLRALAYPDTAAFCVCFAISSPDSFDNAKASVSNPLNRC